MKIVRRSAKAESRKDKPRYVSTLQKDVRKYHGWTLEQVEASFEARRSVHTIITIGYMEYKDGILVLTEKGASLMRNVPASQAHPAERGPVTVSPSRTANDRRPAVSSRHR